MMSSQRGVRVSWVAACIVATAAVVTSVFVVAHALALHHWESAFASQMQVALRVVGSHVRVYLEATMQQLGQVGSQPSARATGASRWCLGELERVRWEQPRLVRATLLFDQQGRQAAPPPVGGWREDELAAASNAGRRAIAGRCTVVEVAAGTPSRGRSLVAVVGLTPDPAGELTEVGALGLILDGEQLLGTLAESLVSDGQGVAFLAARDGRVAAVTGGERPSQAATVSELLEDGNGFLRLLTASLAEPRTPWHACFGDRREEMVGIAEPLTIAGEAWTLAALWPRRTVARGLQPILLVGGAALLLLVAGLVGTGSAWFRKEQMRAAAVREAEWWRNLAERQEREGRWRDLADHSPHPLVCLRGLVVQSANLAAVNGLAGGNRQQLVGRSFLDFLAPADRDRFVAHLAGLSTALPGANRITVHLATVEGQELSAEFSVATSQEEGETLAYLSWRSPGALERSESLLRAVTSAVPVALVFCDPAGNLLWTNAAFSERTKYSAGSFVGRPLLPVIEQAYRRQVLGALAQARRGRETTGRLRLRCESGEIVEASFRAQPVMAGGEQLGVLFTGSELGEGGGGAESAEAARNRVLSHLGTSLAHRLRNDLQALLGILADLKPAATSERRVADVQHLVGSAVEDLRRFVAISRSGAGTPRELRLGELLDRWVAGAQSRLPKRIRLTARRETGEDRVTGEATQLVLALDIALAASVSAMGEGGGAVEVRLEPGQQPATVRITVADTGTFGSDSGVAAVTEGELLFSRQTALALAELVARRHRGRSQSKVHGGIGGRLWIELPLAAETQPPIEAWRGARRHGAILLADDEEMVRSTLASALRANGREVVEAGNGLEAVEAIVREPERFALVILDLVMPVMDGREALRRLREQAPQVPVVVCTGYDPSGDPTLVAAGLMIKPFSIDEFLAKIGELLGESGGGGGAEGGSIS